MGGVRVVGMVGVCGGGDGVEGDVGGWVVGLCVVGVV